MELLFHNCFCSVAFVLVKFHPSPKHVLLLLQKGYVFNRAMNKLQPQVRTLKNLLLNYCFSDSNFFHEIPAKNLSYFQELKRWKSSTPLQERKLVDKFRLCARGGCGGDGCSSFRKSRQARHGYADGGNGGKGGDVILECTESVWDFSHLQHNNNARLGGKGSSKRRIGSPGIDKILQVPVGTVIHLVEGTITSPLVEPPRVSGTEFPWENQNRSTHVKDECEEASKTCEESKLRENWKSTVVHKSELNTPLCEETKSSSWNVIEDEEGVEKAGEVGATQHEAHLEITHDDDDDGDALLSEEEEMEESTRKEIIEFSVAELVVAGERIRIACGGEGGRGNASMPRGRGKHKVLPISEHEPGQTGTYAYVVLELKTLADIGLVGAPNAGKSTLLGALSKARPRVGHYAFTTLRPNLGKLEYEDFFSVTVADIPGLIEGAHQNRGLGHEFLRHIERSKALAYVVDVAASLGGREGSPPWVQLSQLQFELEKYQKGLSSRPSLVIANKMDEDGSESMLTELRQRLPLQTVVPVSAVLEEGIDELRMAIRHLIEGGQRDC